MRKEWVETVETSNGHLAEVYLVPGIPRLQQAVGRAAVGQIVVYQEAANDGVPHPWRVLGIHFDLLSALVEPIDIGELGEPFVRLLAVIQQAVVVLVKLGKASHRFQIGSPPFDRSEDTFAQASFRHGHSVAVEVLAAVGLDGASDEEADPPLEALVEFRQTTIGLPLEELFTKGDDFPPQHLAGSLSLVRIVLEPVDGGLQIRVLAIVVLGFRQKQRNSFLLVELHRVRLGAVLQVFVPGTSGGGERKKTSSEDWAEEHFHGFFSLWFKRSRD